LLDSEPDLEVVATCGSASEALSFLEQTPVDVVLLDYDLGEEQGSVFLETATQRGSTSRILLVTAGMSDATTLRVFETGASGIFLKHSNPAELIRAIRTVQRRDLVGSESGTFTSSRGNQQIGTARNLVRFERTSASRFGGGSRRSDK
jgi:DNA-binding NarL/FixJ family response regulator